MVSVQIETHGCKLNTADSQAMAAAFLRCGFTIFDGSDDAPDIFVLNSCTVTHVADKKARQAISSARRRFPEALTVMTGCYPERAADEVATLNGVDLAIGNRDKSKLVESVADRLNKELTPCSDGGAYVLSAALMGRTRASVKIQEGCDQVCAYCIVPKVRGRERSVPVAEIVKRVHDLETAGCREVIFTGTQLGHYGFDLGDRQEQGLAHMLRTVLIETDIPRIRVSSLQPPEIDADLLSLWSYEGAGRLCPHFHMPLQSGSDEILKRMRRTYTASEFLTKIDLVRSAVPDVGITTDVISGFPGETHTDHEATVATMRAASFSAAHVFPYSARPGTSAYHYNRDVAPEIKSGRARQLREIAAETAIAFRKSQLGSVRAVLWEGRRGAAGLTDNYLKVKTTRSEDEDLKEGARDGLIEDVRLAELDEDGVLVAAADSANVDK